VTAISIEDVAVQSRSQRVLEGISIRIGCGDRVVLVGPNGAGKTTLLRAILGLQTLSAGRILIDGQTTHALSPQERAAKLAWLPQQALADEPITTLEYVAAARFRFHESSRSAREAALRALGRVDAEPWAPRLVTQLSGGEQQRVALAALLAQQSQIVLADEPANHLDPAQQAAIWGLLGQFAASGTMIVVTHDVNWVAWLGPLAGTRIVALKQGRVAFDLMANDALLTDRLSELYGIRMRAHGDSRDRVIIAAGPSGETT
jgi:iron complex transport system ATP-binding protein